MSEILEMMQKIRFSGVEAAADFYGSSPHVHPHNSKSESFKDGAEWQKEQYKDLITLMRQLLGAYDYRYPETKQLLVGYTNEEAFNKLNNLIEKLS